MICKHKYIRTWVIEDTGEPAGLWSCVDCGLKFEPITQRKPLPHSVMVKHMKESCDSMEMRGAFADGWMSAEAAHGIYAPTERKGEA